MRELAASIFGGGTVQQGLLAIAGIGGIQTSTSLGDIAVRVISIVLGLITLAGVIAVIVAGIYLIMSNGDDGQKDKAKKIVIYVIIGLIVVLLSRVIVLFINSLL